MSTSTNEAGVSASDVDVIAALRLAHEATEDWERFGQVAAAILDTARETPAENTGGVRLLIELQRAGALAFRVGD